MAKININKKKHLLLFSALDWGLGHTLRTVPILHEFVSRGYQVVAATNAHQREILRKELPNIEFAELQGYDISYGHSGLSTLLKIIIQIPKILRRIEEEKRWLNKFLDQHSVSIIISDNRYGFYSDRILSIILTHQIAPRTGCGRWVNRIVQFWVNRRISKFHTCWIPDLINPDNIAGELSHPAKIPAARIKYIGLLSRFRPCEDNSGDFLLILLSGPEPQRTVLEKMLVEQITSMRIRSVVVRGTQSEEISSTPEMTVLNYVAAAELNRLICSASLIICRSGYSTIMDVLKLRKKSLMIPTPGQHEQLYLAKHLAKKRLICAVSQENFRLPGALEQSRKFDYAYLHDVENYKGVIDELLTSSALEGAIA